MAKITFEQPFANEAEAKLAKSIEALLKNATFENDYGDADCRRATATIRTLFQACDVDMMIGAGGSHVWIHRTSEFVAGNPTHPNNIRWAFIAD